MTRAFWTAGYTGHKPEELKRIAERLGALVCDVRISPRSRNPAWNGANVLWVLGMEFYRHLPDFGNKNYRGDYGTGVVLADFADGERQVRQSEKPVILLCMCPERHGCHRNTLARLLSERGYDDRGEVDWSMARTGPDTPAVTLPMF